MKINISYHRIRMKDRFCYDRATLITFRIFIVLDQKIRSGNMSTISFTVFLGYVNYNPIQSLCLVPASELFVPNSMAIEMFYLCLQSDQSSSQNLVYKYLIFAAYENRFPEGSKTVLYKKSKLEKFAPYVQEDGLVTRITAYADYDWIRPEFVYEYYSNRVDCLLEVRRNLISNCTVEVFKRGRGDCLRGIVTQFYASSYASQER